MFSVFRHKGAYVGLEREKTTLGYIEVGVAATWYSFLFKILSFIESFGSFVMVHDYCPTI